MPAQRHSLEPEQGLGDIAVRRACLCSIERLQSAKMQQRGACGRSYNFGRRHMTLEQQRLRLEDVELAAQFGNERNGAGISLAIAQIGRERDPQALRRKLGLKDQTGASERQTLAARYSPEIERL